MLTLMSEISKTKIPFFAGAGSGAEDFLRVRIRVCSLEKLAPVGKQVGVQVDVKYARFEEKNSNSLPMYMSSFAYNDRQGSRISS